MSRRAPTVDELVGVALPLLLPHRIEWTISVDDISGHVYCDAEEGTFCRMSCAAHLCEEWPAEGCEHGLEDNGYCNVVEFIENGDSIQSAYIGPPNTPMWDGAIVPEWQGDYYGWRYPVPGDASQPRDDLVPASSGSLTSSAESATAEEPT